MDAGASNNSPSIKSIFNELKGRRAGMVKALTIDVENFYRKCDPGKGEVCLFGFPNSNWEVSFPSEKVPSVLPEPTVGINLLRDKIPRKDWLSMVAKHSDSWLLVLSSYYGTRFGFDKAQRELLFDMINSLPTILEVVTGKVVEVVTEKPPEKKEKKCSKPEGKYSKSLKSETKDENGLEEKEKEDEENTLCGVCEKNYVADGFWICCDFCSKWFHGKCVNITAARAEHVKKYKCPTCNSKRARA